MCPYMWIVGSTNEHSRIGVTMDDGICVCVCTCSVADTLMILITTKSGAQVLLVYCHTHIHNTCTLNCTTVCNDHEN